MTDRVPDNSWLEPERYELHAGPDYHFDLDRRDFFRVFGSGILILLASEGGFSFQESGARPQRGRGGQAPAELSAWIHIGEDGSVTVYTGKVEVGQNARTSLSQVVAEELRIPVSSVRLVMGDTESTPYDAGTFGSRTTPAMAPQLRKAAASAREILLELAAERLETDRNSLTIDGGKVSHSGNGKSVSFGELTKGQKLTRTVNETIHLTPVEHWRIAGQSIPKVEGRALVTGKHQYTSDLNRPEMMFGKVVRPAAFGAKLESADTSEAEKIEGVKIIRDGDFVAVAAPSQHLASQALSAVRAKWASDPQPSHRELFQYLKSNVAESRSEPRIQGSVEEGFAVADKKLEAIYTVAYIAHVPLEPRAAVAEWKEGKLTVWTGTQRPFGVRTELCNAFHLPEDRVRVIVPDTGSGYGGKHTGEAALEAARIAKSVGHPIKLAWTREEEFTWAYLRPAGVIEVSSGVKNEGAITAWEFHNYNSGASAIGTSYDIPHQKIQFHPSRSPLRQGSYRSLAAAANHFARESHMDELAHTVGMDPLEFRLKNLKDSRLGAVLEAAAERFGWNRKAPSGHGFGIMGGFEKGSYIAVCAEVIPDLKKRDIKVTRVVAAFDCGAVINPEHLKNQIEGSLVMGLGGALFESIQFENGTILNPLLSRYRVPRFSDLPSLEVVLVDRKDLPSAGAGETPLVGIAPAIGNAVFQATGIRLRSLPMLTSIPSE